MVRKINQERTSKSKTNLYGKPQEYNQNLKKTRFRRPTKWKVKNRILLGLLWVENIKPVELAKMTGVHPRTVNRWIYEGCKPSEENQEKVSKILNVPSYILFPETAYNKS